MTFGKRPKTRTTTRTRFSQYYVVRLHETVSFWRDNVIAVVTLVFARMSECSGGNKLSNVRSFIIL